MAEKVKVSKQVFEALERCKSCKTQLRMENFLLYNASINGFSLENKVLNSLGVKKMAEIVLYGYELEMTTEERLLEIYNNHKEKPSIQPMWNEGYMDGMKCVLRHYDIEIEGINK